MLSEEIQKAAKAIVTDGYEMSIGEIVSMYRDEEIFINPEFQRYFRWKNWQKTKFIESLLLGIPIPPIFVFQLPGGKWELVDGLQRLSTVFEFMGILKLPDGSGKYPPLELSGTKLLPALDQMLWESADGASFTQEERLRIKRARIRVEILKSESDPKAKYELFNRLNSAGSELTEQEIRNCMLLMVNKPFYEWLVELSRDQNFITANRFSEDEMTKRKDIEWAMRFIVYRNISFERGLDIHEYLDEGALQLANSDLLDKEAEGENFKTTFSLIAQSLGNDAFRKFDGTRFTGKNTIAAFEMVSIGVSRNLEYWRERGSARLKERIQELWSDQFFQNYSGGGVSGSARLTNLLSYGPTFFSE